MTPHVVSVIITNYHNEIDSVESFIAINENETEKTINFAEDHFKECLSDQELSSEDIEASLDDGYYTRNDNFTVWLSHSINSKICS